MREVNILNYLPEFMQEYKEIKCILELENKELQKEYEEIERAFNNSFIFSTDKQGIAIFEKMMKIYPKSTDTLQERQNRVYAKWNAVLPYTWKWLGEYLTAYFNDTNTVATPVLFNQDYRLDIRLKKEEQFNEHDYNVFKELRVLIPANLTLNIVNVIPEKRGDFFIKSAVIYKLKKQIEDKAVDTVSTGEYFIRSGIVYKIKKEMV
ncbi:putative phage tail protein [Fusobacterium mortiferum]|uniref:putative phage tail protein n=1 Tax=Fusobacterium mortiferum TaxID=850 RepID=UPI00195E7AE7|nr:DUF2313 domain-containing protein [Fusobacterium mortiferum]